MQITSEQEYWKQISGGDKKAYELVFRAYYQLLCNYSLSVIKDKDEAEEVVQNVFYNLWYKRESLDINTSLKSYLYRAVHNDCLNRIKHIKVRRIYAEDYKATASGQSPDAEKLLEGKQLQTRIYQAIDALPEQCGLVFRMSRFENLKYSEIAAQLNISVKTVENHMGKALKLLREGLKDQLSMLAFLIMLIY